MDLFSPYRLEIHQWVFAVVAAPCLGMSKTGFTGMSMLGIALMAEVWPARQSTGVILPMLIFGDFFGALAGQWLLKVVPQLWFERLLLASAALAAVGLIWH